MRSWTSDCVPSSNASGIRSKRAPIRLKRFAALWTGCLQGSQLRHGFHPPGCARSSMMHGLLRARALRHVPRDKLKLLAQAIHRDKLIND